MCILGPYLGPSLRRLLDPCPAAEAKAQQRALTVHPLRLAPDVRERPTQCKERQTLNLFLSFSLFLSLCLSFSLAPSCSRCARVSCSANRGRTSGYSIAFIVKGRAVDDGFLSPTAVPPYARLRRTG